MLRNILAGWIGLAVVGVTTLIMTPALIFGLGEFHYGMWILAASITESYGLFDLGMRWTVFRFVSRFKGACDREALNETFAAGFAGTCAIGVVLIVVTLALTTVVPDFFHAPAAERATFRRVLALLGAGAALMIVVQFLGAYLRGLQRFDLDSAGLSGSSILRAVVLIGVLRTGHGVLGAAAASLGVAAATLVFYAWLIRRADPGLQFGRPGRIWRRARELMSYSVYICINTGGEYLRYSVGEIVVGRTLGLGTVAPFSIATRLVAYMRMGLQSAGGPVMTSMSESDGARRQDQFAGLLLRSTRGMALLSLCVAAILILDGKQLIRCWVGDRFLVCYPALVILTAGYLVLFIIEPCRLLVFAQGRYHRVLSCCSLLEGVAGVALGVVLGRIHGIGGVALGVILPAVVLRGAIQPRYALSSCKVSWGGYIRKGLLPPLAAAATFAAISLAAGAPFESPSRAALAGTLAWQLPLFGALAWGIALSRSERRACLQVCRLVRAGEPEAASLGKGHVHAV